MAPSSALLALLLVATFAVTSINSRVVPYNSREKRQAYQMIYPPRTLMFTSFYRPARQSTAEGSSNAQASGVYAQGNAVGGETFFQQQQPQPRPTHVLSDKEPQSSDEPKVAISDAVAAPDEPTAAGEGEQEQLEQPGNIAVDMPQGSNSKPASEESSDPQRGPSYKSGTKKTKKIPVAAQEDDDEYNDEEEGEEEIEVDPLRPPGKIRNTKPYSFNNFFPVVFTFPTGAAAGRRGSASGSSGNIPGLITAIANSYSTSKGGVASSVATAYGGTPMKKPRRSSAATD